MNVIISGANGGIGKALVQHYVDDGHQVYCLTHGDVAALPSGIADALSSDWVHNPEDVVHWLESLDRQGAKPELVISCTGFLHSPAKGPEKQLAEVGWEFLMRNMELNCFAHVALSQCLDHLFGRKDSFIFAALSAMVGSISDNQLGGWYSYRMSKAALNMFIKTLSVEWKRRYPNATAVAVHPGTTDSPLSAPFQSRIPDGKLYSPELTARRLARVFNQLRPEQSGDLLFWDGSRLDY